MAKHKTMTVGDVLDQLKGRNRNLPVIIPGVIGDADYYRPVMMVDDDNYVADARTYGHLDQGDDRAIACVVLWPVN